MTASRFLCADIGATNARFAAVLQSDQHYALEYKQVYNSPSFASFNQLIEQVINDFGTDYQATAIALPGPIINKACNVTNLPWIVSANSVSNQIGIDAHLLNDLEAQGWGIKVLPSDKIHPLTDLRPGIGNACVIAPGSDLGEAVLYWDGSIHRPFPTEGGHCDFSAVDEKERLLFDLLYEQYGHARWGQVLSGPGITTLYRLISKDSDCSISGEDITNLAVNGDEAALHVMQRFVAMLGRESANLALKSMAVGGVYIGGGIVPALPIDWLKNILVSSFRDKPSMRELLERIPIYLVDSDDLGLIGGAHYLSHQAR